MADENTAASTASTSGTATATDDGPKADEAHGTAGADDAGGASPGGSAGREGDGFDLRSLVKQFASPMIESLDARLREQVEAHTDALMDEKVDAAVSDRLATIERAIADLSRSIDGLERRLEAMERSSGPAELE